MLVLQAFVAGVLANQSAGFALAGRPVLATVFALFALANLIGAANRARNP